MRIQPFLDAEHSEWECDPQYDTHRQHGPEERQEDGDGACVK